MSFVTYPIELPPQTALTALVYKHEKLSCRTDVATSTTSKSAEDEIDPRPRMMMTTSKIAKGTLLLVEQVACVEASNTNKLQEFMSCIGFDLPLVVNLWPRENLPEEEEEAQRQFPQMLSSKVRNNGLPTLNEDDRKLLVGKKSMKQVDQDKCQEAYKNNFNRICLGLWLSMFNHSCSPNASYAVRDMETGGYVFAYVFATEDIPADTEVCIRYGPCNIFAPRCGYECKCKPPTKTRLTPDEFFELVSEEPKRLHTFIQSLEGMRINQVINQHMITREKTPNDVYKEMKDAKQEIQDELKALESNSKETGMD